MNFDRIKEIDLLRFVAAISVVLFHYSSAGYWADEHYSLVSYPAITPVMKYGFLGVHLFFIISGFVILMSASSTSVRRFFISRAVRLYPTFWISCSLTFAFILILQVPGVTASWREYFQNLTMIGGFVGWPMLDGVYWSLFVEMQFYGLVIILLLIRQIHRAQLFLSLWLIVVCVLEYKRHFWLRYLLIADFAPYFIAGGAFYLSYARGLNPSRAALLLAAWALAVYQSLCTLASYSDHLNLALSRAIVVAIISVFFAIFLWLAVRSSSKGDSSSWILLGGFTYPIYLLHQKIGYLIFNTLHGSTNLHILFWGTVLFMVALSYFVNQVAETRVAPTLKKLLNLALRPPKSKLRVDSSANS